jgi:hypothetical protein
MKSKTAFIFTLLLLPLITGCSIIENRIKDRIYTADNIKKFVGVGTDILLKEIKPTQQDAKNIKLHLTQIKDRVDKMDQVDFPRLRESVKTMPKRYQFFGTTIIRMIERFISAKTEDFSDKNEKTVLLVSSGLEGAITAIQDYINKF